MVVGYPRPSYLIRFDVSSLTAVYGAGHLGHDMTECRIDPLVITTYVDKMYKRSNNHLFLVLIFQIALDKTFLSEFDVMLILVTCPYKRESVVKHAVIPAWNLLPCNCIVTYIGGTEGNGL